MLNWFRALMPREERFFDLFTDHARIVAAAAEALQATLRVGEGVRRHCQEVVQWEQEADAITREVLLAVRRSFITPFDRSDIQDLITSLDDAIDEMQETAKAIMLYEVHESEPGMQAMGEIIVQCANLICDAMPLLRAINSNAGQINAIAEEISRLEDRADNVYDEGLRALFKAHGVAHPVFIIGSRIFDRLEEVVDSFDDVGNEISGIVIMHA